MSTMFAQPPSASERTRLTRGQGSRYAWAVLSGVLARSVVPLLSIVVTPYALTKLGPERFGLFVVALTMSGWLTLLDPGLAPGLRIVLARRSADLDGTALAPTLGAAALGQNVAAAATLAAGVGLAWIAPGLIAAPAALNGEARGLFLLIAAGTAVGVLGRRHAAALDACQWASVGSAIQLGQNLLRIALLALLLMLGLDLRGVGWSYLVACAAGALGLAAASRRLLPELQWKAAAATRAGFLELARPGVWLSLGSFAGVLIAGLDRFVAARTVSLDAVTTLALTGAAFLLVESLLTSTVDAARPAIGQALGEGRRAEAARIYTRLAKGAAAAGALAAVSVFAGNRAFVIAWAGAKSYGGGALDAWFALALLANLWSLPHRALLSADLRAREATLWRLAEGFVNLALSIGLALRFGLAGVAAGTALAAACTSLWALPRLAGRSAGISAWQAMRPLLHGLALLAGLAPVALLARAAANEGGWLAAAFAATVVTVCGCALWWRACLSEESRRLWMGLVRARRITWPAAV